MEIIKIATHDGFFHADELFAIAALKLKFQKLGNEVEIIRTRDKEKAFLCDYVVDVGREYNPDKNHFDHHQIDASLVRENSIPYAAFGLIWKHFGHNIVSSEAVYEIVEKRLVQPIDAMDNALKLSTRVYEDLYEYNIANAIEAISISYTEKGLDEAFDISLKIVESVLKGEIKKAEDRVASEKVVTDEINKQGQPNILILDKYHSWRTTVVNFPNIKFVLFPDIKSEKWYLQPAKNSLEEFGDERIKFPNSWLGKEDGSLAEASGIEEAVFCHKSGYLAVAKNKQGAIQMAEKTLETDIN